MARNPYWIVTRFDEEGRPMAVKLTEDGKATAQKIVAEFTEGATLQDLADRYTRGDTDVLQFLVVLEDFALAKQLRD